MANDEEIHEALKYGKTFMEEITNGHRKKIVFKMKKEKWERDF